MEALQLARLKILKPKKYQGENLVFKVFLFFWKNEHRLKNKDIFFGKIMVGYKI